MELVAPPLKLELANQSIIQFEVSLLKYIAYFKSLYEEGFEKIQEDPAFRLPWVFWDWLHAILAEHEDVYLDDEGLKVPLHLEKTKEVGSIALRDLYRILRAVNFYDIPLVTDLLIKEVLRRTLPLSQRELMLAHPSINPPKINELMISEPIELLNERYSVHRAFLMKIYRTFLNIYDLYNLIDVHYLPRVTNIIAATDVSLLIISKTGLFNHNFLEMENKWDNMNINDAISIWASLETLMILTDKGLFASGRNDFGQLGLGTKGSSVSFKMRSKIDLPQVLAVACSAVHSVFLTVDGVYATGFNQEGQLGNGTIIRRTVPTPVDIEETIKIVAISVAPDYSLFLSDKGIVYFTGRTPNDDIMPNVKVRAKILLPTALVLPENTGKIIAISSASTGYTANHSILIDDKQDVYLFGDNLNGQLGLGHTNRIIGIQKHPTLKSIIKARALRSWSFFIDNDRNLYACGLNADNELDVRLEGNITTPILILNTGDVIDVTIFQNEMYILRCDGLYLNRPRDLAIIKQKLDVEDLALCVPTLTIEEEEAEEPEQKRKRFQALHCYQCGSRENLSIHQPSRHLFCSFDCLAQLRAFSQSS